MIEGRLWIQHDAELASSTRAGVLLVPQRCRRCRFTLGIPGMFRWDEGPVYQATRPVDDVPTFPAAWSRYLPAGDRSQPCEGDT